LGHVSLCPSQSQQQRFYKNAGHFFMIVPLLRLKPTYSKDKDQAGLQPIVIEQSRLAVFASGEKGLLPPLSPYRRGRRHHHYHHRHHAGGAAAPPHS
jgi:hypothetical protein